MRSTSRSSYLTLLTVSHLRGKLRMVERPFSLLINFFFGVARLHIKGFFFIGEDFVLPLARFSGKRKPVFFSLLVTVHCSMFLTTVLVPCC